VRAVFSIVMSVLMLTTNLGWIQSTHYCLGRPVEANLGLEITHLSCNMIMAVGCSEEMEQKPGCCHNEFDKFSLDHHLLGQGFDFIPQTEFFEIPQFGIIDFSYDLPEDPQCFFGAALEDPPPKQTHLFILNQQWLI